MKRIHLLTLDPAHFHAALVQKQPYPQVAPTVHVYAPLGPDLLAHLQRIAGFNSRAAQPTAWQLEVHAGPDFAERCFREKPGNVVVLSGRNRGKIDYILAAVQAGLHVLADKPWILTSADLPKLQRALDSADAQGLIAYDIMTERHEITSLLQRDLVNDPAVFGSVAPSTPEQPALSMESVHFLLKQVAGAPLRRPPWFFDIAQQGEGLTDVGTHLVDLAAWLLLPGQALDPARDVRLLDAKRWPTLLRADDFQKITGEAAFPAWLEPQLREGQLAYFCNNQLRYALRGIHVTLDILWGLEAAAGAGDTHLAIVRGTQAHVEVRQGAEQRYRPELYVVPTAPGARAALRTALQQRVAAWQTLYPGVGVEEQTERFQIVIPERYRIGHEAHFAEVTQDFLRYIAAPATLPAWEKPNMLAKYYVTTHGVELGQSQ